MRFSLNTVTPPADVPLVFTEEEAKIHLKVDHDEDDALLMGMIRSAQATVERYCGQVLTRRQMRWSAARFPALPAPLLLCCLPVREIVSVEHMDAEGGLVTLPPEAWRWSEAAGDEVYPAIRGDWPAIDLALGAGAARVTFVAGYDEGLCPADLSAAVKLTLGCWYRAREAGGEAGEMPKGATMLASPYRRFRFLI